MARLPAVPPAGMGKALQAAGLAQDVLDVLQHQGWDAYKRYRSARQSAAKKLLLGLRKGAKRRAEEGEGQQGAGGGGGGGGGTAEQQDETEQPEEESQVGSSLAQAEAGGSVTPTPPALPAESVWRRLIGTLRLRALLRTATRVAGGGGGAAELVGQGGVRGPDEDM